MKKMPIVSLVIILFSSACIFRNRAATVAVNPTAAAAKQTIAVTTAMVNPAASATIESTAAAAPVVTRAAGGTHKIRQLTGDTDRELN
jgi:hypothetical protein